MEPVKSIEEFIGRMKQIKQETGFEYYYRGHADYHYKLVPSIYRKRKKTNKSYINDEDKIFREIILRTPGEFSNEKTTIEKLVKMQHYGLPTRILDISSNPLVALFFACNEKSNQHDGEVVALEIPKAHIKYYDSDTVSILSNISRRPASFDISDALKAFDQFVEDPPRKYVLDPNDEEEVEWQAIRAFNHTHHIARLLHEIRDEKPQFLSIINPKDFKRVLAVRVKLNNGRIQKQAGAFLLFGIDKKKQLSAKVQDKWVVNKTNRQLNLRIAAHSKEVIIADLDKLGINESSLYPEIDRQAAYIKGMF